MKTIKSIAWTPELRVKAIHLITDNSLLSLRSCHAGTLCHEYKGRWHDGKGYKKMKLEGRTLYVHRVAYEMYGNVIPAGQILDHKCRNPGCCNPDHLEPVTVRENTERGNGKWIFEQ
jgi:isocitrate/isopropylmalate dehydrogenase